jgi:hypothetical protein
VEPIGVLTPEEEAKAILGLNGNAGSNGGGNGHGVLGQSLVTAGASVVLRPGLAELLDLVGKGAQRGPKVRGCPKKSLSREHGVRYVVPTPHWIGC